jgi:hypothetical protein
VIVPVSMQHVSGIPGTFGFVLTADVAGKQVYMSSFNVEVQGIDMSISTVGNTYTLDEADLSYNIYITNKGAAAETFTIALSGLPTGSFSIEETSIFIPAAGVGSFRVNVLKSAVPNLDAGAIGFNVVVSTTAYTTDRSSSAVMVSEYYAATTVPAVKN